MTKSRVNAPVEVHNDASIANLGERGITSSFAEVTRMFANLADAQSSASAAPVQYRRRSLRQGHHSVSLLTPAPQLTVTPPATPFFGCRHLRRGFRLSEKPTGQETLECSNESGIVTFIKNAFGR